MLPQPENRGGLLGQLRDYALRGSDDGAWAEHIPQQSIFSRSVSLRGEPFDILRVEFNASRIRQGLASQAIRTAYSLKAVMVEQALTLEYLPQNVVDSLRRQKVAAATNEGETEYIYIDPEEEGEIEEDDDLSNMEDMEFRHVRSVHYNLNGRGSLISVKREDFYEDDDEGGVDIVGMRSTQSGNHENEELGILTLEGWGDNPYQEDALDFVVHPDLQKLQVKSSIKDLRDDVSFLAIVEQYSFDKRLARYTHQEHRRSMLALLAFLRMDATSKQIQELL